MTFLQLDGFDAYKVGDVQSASTWHGSPFGGGTPGRFGDGSAITVITNNEIWQSMNPSIVGFAFRNTNGNWGAGGPICYRMQYAVVCADPTKACGPTVIDFKVGVGLDAANSPYVFTTNWTSQACPGHPDHCDQYTPATTVYYGWGETPQLDYDQWNYAEINFDTLELRLNGETVVTSASTQTGHGTNFSESGIADDRLYIQVPGLNEAIDIDDFYAQGAGGAFIGDIHIKTLYPDADGHYAQWTPGNGGSGSTHYSRVDEVRFDGDASFNYDDTAGDRDSYLMQPMTVPSATIYATQLNLAASVGRGVSSATFRPFVRQGGTDYDGPSVTLTSADAGYWLASFLSDTDPTGAPWTVTTVNGDEYGIHLESVT